MIKYQYYIFTFLFNFDVPPDPEDYVHRVGRTARAETTGTAITFINERDQNKFHSIETLIGDTISKLPLPESIGEGPAYVPRQQRNVDFKKRTSFRKRPPRK